MLVAWLYEEKLNAVFEDVARFIIVKVAHRKYMPCTAVCECQVSEFLSFYPSVPSGALHLIKQKNIHPSIFFHLSGAGSR